MSEFIKVSNGIFKKKKWAFRSSYLSSDIENTLLKMMTTSLERPDDETENLYKIVDAYMFVYLKRLVNDIDKLAGNVDFSIISHIKESVDFSSFDRKDILIYVLTHYTVVEMQKFEEMTEIQTKSLNKVVTKFLAVIFPTSTIAGHWQKTCDLLRNYEKQYGSCIESDFMQIADLYNKLLTSNQQKSIASSMLCYDVYKGNLESGTHLNCVKHMSKVNTDFSAEDWFLLFISNLSIQRYIEDEEAYYTSLALAKTNPSKSEKAEITRIFRVTANCNKHFITQCMAMIAGYTDENVDVISDSSNISPRYHLMRLFDKKKMFLDETSKLTIKEMEDDINEVVMKISSKS